MHKTAGFPYQIHVMPKKTFSAANLDRYPLPRPLTIIFPRMPPIDFYVYANKEHCL